MLYYYENNSDGTINAEVPVNIVLFSFGFKHGQAQADMVWDARFLPNPYWVAELKPYTGKDAAVAAYVLESSAAQQFLGLFEPLLFFLIDQYAAANRETLTIAVGCTGGRHRSVALVEYLRDALVSQGLRPQVYHRDIEKE